MVPLSDAELLDLLNSPESDRSERKQEWKGEDPKKALQSICAFANDLANHGKPGVLFVGVRDDGSPAGISVDDKLLQTLANAKTDGRITPPPTMTVERRHLKGADMAVVTVYPADAPPVRYEGRIWVRTGSRLAQATAQDERILNEKRRFRDRLFEAQPVRGSSLDDLSRIDFEHEYLTNAVAPDVLAANARSYEQRLASCGMVIAADDPIPTVLGHLVLGITPRTWIPGDYIQFLRIDGTELSDPIIDSVEIDGTLSMKLRLLDEKLRAHLTTRLDFTSQDRETRVSAYPLAALQQLARNAVMHRTYEGTNAPTRLYWFNDRIEILNPGGPYGTVTRENFGKPGYTDYRNPQLAGAFKVLGYAQRFGAGISIAQAELKKNGNPPAEFDVQDNFILATIRKAP